MEMIDAWDDPLTSSKGMKAMRVRNVGILRLHLRPLAEDTSASGRRRRDAICQQPLEHRYPVPSIGVVDLGEKLFGLKGQFR